MLINAQSICNKIHEFSHLLSTHAPSIVAITESWLHPQMSINFLDVDSKYNIFHRDRDSHGGGVCLLVSNSIKCVSVSFDLDLPGCEMLCVDLVTHDGHLRLVVCYRSTSLAHQSLETNFRLINCLNKLCNVKHTCLLMGDFNLPKINWCTNFVKTDAIHEAFYEYFSSAGLTQLVSFPTRYDATLDLVFCNDPEIISNLMPLPHLGKSDHDIVSFSMRLPASIPPKVQPSTEVRVRNYAECNYDLLNADLFAIDWNVVFINCISADEHWSAFTLVLNNLLDVHCPLFPNITRHRRKSFHYPQSIKRLQAHKSRVWRRWRSNKSCDRIRTEYKLAADAYTEAIRNFHRDREVNILNSHNSSNFHKFIRRQLKRTENIPTLVDVNNVQIDDCDVKANLFNEFFCSTFTHDNNILPPFPSRITSDTAPLDHILFTPNLVSTKLLNLTKSTTLNPENFPPIVLQSCAH